jgi:calmodulin
MSYNERKLVTGLDQQNETELTELKEAFQAFDKDGNGSISLSEINEVLRALKKDFTEQQLTQIINKYDENGDGEIDFGEFTNMMKKEGDTTDELVQAFNVFDMNGDGYISAMELFVICDSLGSNLDRETIELMIQSVDTDGDGSIDVNEFKMMMLDRAPNATPAQKEEAKREKLNPHYDI